MRLDQRAAGRLLRDRSGTVLTEFAILAPALFLAVIGIIELAILLAVQVMLEGSVREASRFGITGYAPPGVTRDQQIRDIIAQFTVGLVDMNNVVITTRVFPSFDQIVRPEPCFHYLPAGACDTSDPRNYVDVNGNGHWDDGNGTNGSGAAGDIVLYTVHYRHHMMTPLMRPLMGIDGWMPLEASIVVRNEPW
jgi:hypothetical protein